MNRFSLALCAAALCFVALVPACTSAATLAPLPAPVESFDIGLLHVDHYGSGPSSIIMIPGLACGPWEWAREITLLSQNDTVYALTLSGFDGRPYQISGDPFDEFSRDFWALLDARKIARPAVIGHSLGGTLAIALAEEHSDRLAGVLALDGLPVFPTLAQADAAAREKAARGASAQIAAETHDQVLAYERIYMRQIGTLNPSLVEPAAALEARSDPQGIAAWVGADLSHDLRPDLARITIPLVEVMPYAPPSPYTEAQTLSFYQSLLAGAPHATVVPIENARHFAMLDQPKAVDAAITQFLAQAHR
jgi:pimeloyl-ACP methyl ester carboxylesterase